MEWKLTSPEQILHTVPAATEAVASQSPSERGVLEIEARRRECACGRRAEIVEQAVEPVAGELVDLVRELGGPGGTLGGACGRGTRANSPSGGHQDSAELRQRVVDTQLTCRRKFANDGSTAAKSRTVGGRRWIECATQYGIENLAWRPSEPTRSRCAAGRAVGWTRTRTVRGRRAGEVLAGDCSHLDRRVGSQATGVELDPVSLDRRPIDSAVESSRRRRPRSRQGHGTARSLTLAPCCASIAAWTPAAAARPT